MSVLNNSSRLMRIWPLPQTRSLAGESNFSTVDETDYGHNHHEESSLRPERQGSVNSCLEICSPGFTPAAADDARPQKARGGGRCGAS